MNLSFLQAVSSTNPREGTETKPTRIKREFMVLLVSSTNPREGTETSEYQSSVPLAIQKFHRLIPARGLKPWHGLSPKICLTGFID